MGILDYLSDFASDEAGQRRRQWLNRQEDALTDGLRYYLGPAADPILGAAQLAGAMSPGAEVAEAVDSSSDLTQARSPVEIATAGAGLAGSLAAMFVPGNFSTARQGVADLLDAGVDAHNSGALFTFAGPRASTADLGALERARAMTAQGATREDVWRETGWFFGPDGMPRREIDDSLSRFTWPSREAMDANPGGLPSRPSSTTRRFIGPIRASRKCPSGLKT